MNHLILLALMFVAVPDLAAGVQERRDAETGLLSWKVEDQGLSLGLIQLLPDYVRALYAARGLPKEVVEGVTAYCTSSPIL